jgi:hypothetical protein
VVQVSLLQRKNWQEGSGIWILTGGSQKIKTTNIDLETAVLKYIKEGPSQRTYPDPPILLHFCKKQIVHSLKTFKSLKSTWFQRI